MSYKRNFLLRGDVFGLKSKLAEIVPAYKLVTSEKPASDRLRSRK